MNKIFQCILLILILGINYFILNSSLYFDAKSYGFLLFSLPGIFYSLFIMYIFKSSFTILEFLIKFIVLYLMYFLSVIIGFSTWGFAVPFIGGVGAIGIRQLFYNSQNMFNESGMLYLYFGFFSALFGFVILISVFNFQENSIGISLIILIWQLFFGFLWIYKN